MKFMKSILDIKPGFTCGESKLFSKMFQSPKFLRKGLHYIYFFISILSIMIQLSEIVILFREKGRSIEKVKAPSKYNINQT